MIFAPAIQCAPWLFHIAKNVLYACHIKCTDTDIFMFVSIQRSQFSRVTLTLFCRFLNGLIMANQNVQTEYKSQEKERERKASASANVEDKTHWRVRWYVITIEKSSVPKMNPTQNAC